MFFGGVPVSRQVGGFPVRVRKFEDYAQGARFEEAGLYPRGYPDLGRGARRSIPSRRPPARGTRSRPFRCTCLPSAIAGLSSPRRAARRPRRISRTIFGRGSACGGLRRAHCESSGLSGSGRESANFIFRAGEWAEFPLNFDGSSGGGVECQPQSERVFCGASVCKPVLSKANANFPLPTCVGESESFRRTSYPEYLMAWRPTAAFLSIFSPASAAEQARVAIIARRMVASLMQTFIFSSLRRFPVFYKRYLYFGKPDSNWLPLRHRLPRNSYLENIGHSPRMPAQAESWRVRISARPLCDDDSAGVEFQYLEIGGRHPGPVIYSQIFCASDFGIVFGLRELA